MQFVSDDFLILNPCCLKVYRKNIRPAAFLNRIFLIRLIFSIRDEYTLIVYCIIPRT